MDILKPPPYVHSLVTSSMLPPFTRAELQFSFPLSFSFSDSLPPSFLDRRLQLHFCANCQFTLKADDQQFPTTPFNLLTCLPQTFSLPSLFLTSAAILFTLKAPLAARVCLDFLPVVLIWPKESIIHLPTGSLKISTFLAPSESSSTRIFSTSKWKPFSIGFF